jgi:hypothetical protein
MGNEKASRRSFRSSRPRATPRSVDVASIALGGLLLLHGVAPAQELAVSATLDARKVAVGERTHVVVQLSNPRNAPIGPVEISVLPRSLGTAARVNTLAADSISEHDVELAPSAAGSFNVRARVAVPGRAPVTVDAGTLEVVEAANFLTLPVAGALLTALLALAGTVVTLVVTVRKQRQLLNETRQQKAADAVAQIVLQVARDYYGAIGGATSALALAVRRMHAGEPGEDPGHLLARCFFFFGTIVHKDNEFAFSQGLLFLPDLWAEADMRLMIDELLDLVPLTQAQEAVIHKCFSDVAVLQQNQDAARVTFRARSLYDVEKLLTTRGPEAGDDVRRLQDTFDAVASRFRDPEVLMWINDLEPAMRALMEYEFTIMFSDFYGNIKIRVPRGGREGTGRSSRQRPAVLQDFDDIVHTPTWTETRATLERLEARRNERDAVKK